MFANRVTQWGFLVFILALAGCEKVIDFPDSEPKINLYSQFQAGEPFRVYVSEAGAINDEEINYIQSASTEITDLNAADEIDTLSIPSDDGSGDIYYLSERIIPENDGEYKINVEVPGFGNVSASSYVPQPASINSVTVSHLEIQNTDLADFYTLDLIITIDDKPDEDNYYQLNVEYAVEDGFGGSNYQQALYSIPTEIEPAPAVESDGSGVLFRDINIDGLNTEIAVPITFAIGANDVLQFLRVELRTVSRDYYLFHSSVYRQQQTNNSPLAEPVEIYNNVQNGCGIFAGYSLIQVDSIYIN